jgi:signal transduction histidine kinase
MVLHDWALPVLLAVTIAAALWFAHRGRALAAGADALRRQADQYRAAAEAAEERVQGARDEAAAAVKARDQATAASDAARATSDAARAAADEAGRQVAELRDALQAKDEFLATVVHELRTPLNAIVGWGHVLRANAADDVTRTKAIDAMIRNGDRQGKLIADLMDLSRVAAGKLRLELQPDVELAPVVRSALETVRPLADAKGIRLRSNVDAEAGPLTADPHRLQQVLWNLIANAVKFTPRGGEVSIEVVRADQGVELRVSDDGPGVAEELLPHIFDRFRQGSGSARTHGGLGLGLAIVRHLVDLHGGRVSVNNNRPGAGATFVVELPKEAPAASGEPEESARSGAVELPTLEDVTVLVLSPESEERELVADILRARLAEVHLVTTAEEALDAIRRTLPDVVIAELGATFEDGKPLIGRLRALSGVEGGAVVAVAVSSRAGDRLHALLAGYQGHLLRPVDQAELVALVSTLAELSVSPSPA